MKCKVKIGETDCFGEFKRESYGFLLNYLFGNDPCRLQYDGYTLIHEKRGEIPVRAEFCEGRSTKCVIGDGALTGEVDIETRSVLVRDDGKMIIVSVDSLFGGEPKFVEMEIEIGESSHD